MELWFFPMSSFEPLWEKFMSGHELAPASPGCWMLHWAKRPLLRWFHFWSSSQCRIHFKHVFSIKTPSTSCSKLVAGSNVVLRENYNRFRRRLWTVDGVASIIIPVQCRAEVASTCRVDGLLQTTSEAHPDSCALFATSRGCQQALAQDRDMFLWFQKRLLGWKATTIGRRGKLESSKNPTQPTDRQEVKMIWRWEWRKLREIVANQQQQKSRFGRANWVASHFPPDC